MGFDMSIQEYITLLYPKHATDLLQLLPPLQTLEFLFSYTQFQKRFIQSILKSVVYSIVLMCLGIVLCYFFMYRFEPSIRSLLVDFGTNVEQLQMYRFVIAIIISFINILIAGLLIGAFLLQAKDNKIVFCVVMMPRWPFLKYIITYQYTMMLNLFLQFDMKTSSMITFLRSASLGVVNRWLSYHIESELDQGKTFPDALSEQYFDTRMIDFVRLGYIHNDMKGYMDRYCKMMDGEIQRKIVQYGTLFKTVVFCLLVMIVAIFYSVLYLPLQLLEVL